MVKKIISGGQTGVDRAALDAAMNLGIACGGWCPRGRMAADGLIPEKYPLQETTSAEYSERTALNVRDADGTLILAGGPLQGGTALTLLFAKKLDRPYLIQNVAKPLPARIRSWVVEQQIEVLNVAGPREEEFPGIYCQAISLLESTLRPSPSANWAYMPGLRAAEKIK